MDVDVELEGVIGGVVEGDLNLDRKYPLDLLLFHKEDEMDEVVSD